MKKLNVSKIPLLLVFDKLTQATSFSVSVLETTQFISQDQAKFFASEKKKEMNQEKNIAPNQIIWRLSTILSYNCNEN